MNDPESALRNLYRTYVFRHRPLSKMRLSSIDKTRWLGGMEALLQCVGKLPSMVPWELQKIKKKFLFIPYTKTETYEEYILRNCDEFITNSPNTPSLR